MDWIGLWRDKWVVMMKKRGNVWVATSVMSVESSECLLTYHGLFLLVVGMSLGILSVFRLGMVLGEAMDFVWVTRSVLLWRELWGDPGLPVAVLCFPCLLVGVFLPLPGVREIKIDGGN